MRLRNTSKGSSESPYPEDSIGRLMEPPLAVFLPQQTVEEAIETIRELHRIEGRTPSLDEIFVARVGADARAGSAPEK